VPVEISAADLRCHLLFFRLAINPALNFQLEKGIFARRKCEYERVSE
jgi:hypothetical protein